MNNVVRVSGTQQSVSAIHMHVFILPRPNLYFVVVAEILGPEELSINIFKHH